MTHKEHLPFKVTVPLVKVIKEGSKVMKLSLFEYHLAGFTRGKNHAKLYTIQKECGTVDPDILPDLENAGAKDFIQEMEQVATHYVNTNYYTETNLSIVK